MCVGQEMQKGDKDLSWWSNSFRKKIQTSWEDLNEIQNKLHQKVGAKE